MVRALVFFISICFSYPVFGLGLSTAPLILPPYPRLPATPTYQLPPYPTLPPVFASNYQPYRAFMPRPRMGNYSAFGSGGGGALGLISTLLSHFLGGGMNAGFGGNLQAFGSPFYGSSMYSPSYGPTYRPDYSPTFMSSYTPGYSTPVAARPYTPPPVASPPVSVPDRLANTAPDVLPPINTAPPRQSPPPTAPASPRNSAVRIAPDVLNPAEQRAVQARNNAERAAQNSAAWPTFYRLFKQCAPNCEPTKYEAFAHNRYSCHNQGRAIDLHAMVCGGQVISAIQERNQSGPFDQMVRCIQNLGKNPGTRMVALWHQHNGRGITRDHYDHAHFSIGCYNGSYW